MHFAQDLPRNISIVYCILNTPQREFPLFPADWIQTNFRSELMTFEVKGGSVVEWFRALVL